MQALHEGQRPVLRRPPPQVVEPGRQDQSVDVLALVKPDIRLEVYAERVLLAARRRLPDRRIVLEVLGGDGGRGRPLPYRADVEQDHVAALHALHPAAERLAEPYDVEPSPLRDGVVVQGLHYHPVVLAHSNQLSARGTSPLRATRVLSYHPVSPPKPQSSRMTMYMCRSSLNTSLA